MDLGNWLEMAIIVFILGSVALVARRQGAANPVGTGQLDERVTKIETACAGADEGIGDLNRRLEDIEQRAATKTDIRRIEKHLASSDARTDDKMNDVARQLVELREGQAARQAQMDAIARQVEMIYQVIVPKGMK